MAGVNDKNKRVLLLCLEQSDRTSGERNVGLDGCQPTDVESDDRFVRKVQAHQCYNRESEQAQEQTR